MMMRESDIITKIDAELTAEHIIKANLVHGISQSEVVEAITQEQGKQAGYYARQWIQQKYGKVKP